MIFIKDLKVAYGSHIVLDALQLELATGQVHGLLGLNGSGKTTLLTAMLGLKTIQSGSIQYNNLPLTKKDLAFLDTQPFFYSKMTAQEYLDIVVPEEMHEKIQPIAQLLDFPLGEFAEHFSSGMKKKLAIAGVFLQTKPLLILDEPFNSLDLEGGMALKALIRQGRQQGKTILITSHILETLTDICDQMHLLQNGSFTKNYAPAAFPEIQADLFGGWETESRKWLELL